MRTLTYQILVETSPNTEQTLRGLLSRNREIKDLLIDIGKASTQSLGEMERRMQLATGTTTTLKDRVGQLSDEYQQSAKAIAEVNERLRNAQFSTRNIDALRGRLVALQAEFKNLKPDADAALGASLRNEITSTRREINRLADASGDAGKRITSTGNTIESTFKRIGASLLAVFAIDRLVTGATDGIREIIDAGKEFEFQMSKVNAILQLTATGQTDALRDLEAQALQLGITTSFTATQAAEAQGVLAQAGFDSNEITQSVESVIRLAETGSLDLAQAAQIAATSLRSYNRDARDLGEINDILAASFTSANLNIDDFNEAFKLVAPLANTLDIEFEELAATVNTLADAGLRGSIGGTALRGALTFLVKPSAQAKKAINELGLEVFNQDGTFRNFIDIIEDLGKSNASTTQLAEIFGKQVSAVSILVNRSKDGALRDYAVELSRVGTLFGDLRANVDGLSEDALPLFNDAVLAARGETAELSFSTEQVGAAFTEIRKFSADANEGLKNTEAVMAALVNPTEKQRDALGDLSKEFLDSEGNLKSFDEVLKILNREVENGFDLSTVFGDQAKVVAKILGDETAVSIQETTKRLEGFSLANNIATTRLQNTEGAFIRLGSALEGIRIAIFDTFDNNGSSAGNFQVAIDKLADFVRAVAAAVQGVQEGTETFKALSENTSEFSKDADGGIKELIESARNFVAVATTLFTIIKNVGVAFATYTVLMRLNSAAVSLNARGQLILEKQLAASRLATTANTASTSLATIAQTALTRATTFSKNAFVALSASLRANPLGLVLTAVTLLISAYEAFSAVIGDVNKQTAEEVLQSEFKNQLRKASGEILRDTTDAVIDQVREINKLISVINSENASQEARDAALKRLNDKYPEYINYLEIDGKLVKDLTVVQKDLTAAIVETELAKARSELISETLREFVKEDVSLNNELIESGRKEIAQLEERIEVNTKLNDQAKSSAGAFGQVIGQTRVYGDASEDAALKLERLRTAVDNAVSGDLSGLKEYNNITEDAAANAQKFTDRLSAVDTAIKTASVSIIASADALKLVNDVSLAEELEGVSAGETKAIKDRSDKLKEEFEKLAKTYKKAADDQRKARNIIDLDFLAKEEARQLRIAQLETNALVANNNISAEEQALALANIRSDFQERRKKIFDDEQKDLETTLKDRAAAQRFSIDSAIQSIQDLFDIEEKELRASANLELEILFESGKSREQIAEQQKAIEDQLNADLDALGDRRLNTLKTTLRSEVVLEIESYQERIERTNELAEGQVQTQEQLNERRIEETRTLITRLNSIVDGQSNEGLTEQKALLDASLEESKRALDAAEINRQEYASRVLAAESEFQSALIDKQTDGNRTLSGTLNTELDERLKLFKSSSELIVDTAQSELEFLEAIAQERIDLQNDTQASLKAAGVVGDVQSSVVNTDALEASIEREQQLLVDRSNRSLLTQQQFIDNSKELQQNFFDAAFNNQTATYEQLFPQGDFDVILQRTQSFWSDTLDQQITAGKSAEEIQKELNAARLQLVQDFNQEVLNELVRVDDGGAEFRNQISDVGNVIQEELVKLSEELSQSGVTEEVKLDSIISFQGDVDSQFADIRERVISDLNLTQQEIQGLEVSLFQERLRILNNLRNINLSEEEDYLEELNSIQNRIQIQATQGISSAGTIQSNSQLEEATVRRRELLEQQVADVREQGAILERSQFDTNAIVLALNQKFESDIRELRERRIEGVEASLSTNNDVIVEGYKLRFDQIREQFKTGEIDAVEYRKDIDQNEKNLQALLRSNRETEIAELEQFNSDRLSELNETSRQIIGSQRELLETGQITQEEFDNVSLNVFTAQARERAQTVEKLANDTVDILNSNKKDLNDLLKQAIEGLKTLRETGGDDAEIAAAISRITGIQSQISEINSQVFETLQQSSDARLDAFDANLRQEEVALINARRAGLISQEQYEAARTRITAQAQAGRLQLELEGLNTQLKRLETDSDEYIKLQQEIVEVTAELKDKELEIFNAAEAEKRAEAEKTFQDIKKFSVGLSETLSTIVDDQSERFEQRIRDIERAADAARDPLENEIAELERKRDEQIANIETLNLSEEERDQRIQDEEDAAQSQIDLLEGQIDTIDQKEEEATEREEARKERILQAEQRLESFRQLVDAFEAGRAAFKDLRAGIEAAQTSAKIVRTSAETSAEVTASGAKTAASATEGIAKAGSLGFPAGLIAIGSLLAALASGFVAVRNLVRRNRESGEGAVPQFEQGGVVRPGDHIVSGGLAVGPRHSQGGMNIEVEGGEQIINRHASSMFGGILTWINNQGQKSMRGQSYETSIPEDVLSGQAFQRSIVPLPVVGRSKVIAQDGGVVQIDRSAVSGNDLSNKEVISTLNKINESIVTQEVIIKQTTLDEARKRNVRIDSRASQ